jgi:hypothetical protein
MPIHNHNTSQVNPPPTSTTDSPTKIISTHEPTSKTLPDEDFFSLLNRLQSRRIDQQRTCLPSTINSNTSLISPNSSSTPSKRTRVKQ